MVLMTRASTHSSRKRNAKRRLWDIQPSRVDVVDAAANREKWLICKSEGTMGEEVHNEESVLTLLASIQKELMELKEDAKRTEDVEKAKSSAVIREVGERAASLAAAMEASGTDPVKLQDEIANLLQLLMGIMEHYPAPVATDKYPQPVGIEKEMGVGAKTVREVSELAMSLANALESEQPPEEANYLEQIQKLASLLTTVSEKYPDSVCKAEEEVEAPIVEEPSPDFAAVLRKAATDMYAIAASVDSGSSINEGIEGLFAVQAELAPAFEKLPIAKDIVLQFGGSNAEEQKAEFAHMLKSAVAKAGALSAVTGLEVGQDEQARDLGYVKAALDALIGSVPTRAEKSSQIISEALQDSINRAAQLAKQAEELKFDNAENLTELQNVQGTLNGLATKYVDVKKAAYEVNDLSAIFAANKFLDQLNTGLSKLGFITKDEEAPPVEASTLNIVEVLTNLTAKVEALATHFQQTQVEKAVDSIPGPAASKQITTTPDSSESDFPACPDNYNDPGYRALLQARGFDFGRKKR